MNTTPSNDPTAQPSCLPDDTFRFGRNWQRYVAIDTGEHEFVFERTSA